MRTSVSTSRRHLDDPDERGRHQQRSDQVRSPRQQTDRGCAKDPTRPGRGGPLPATPASNRPSRGQTVTIIGTGDVRPLGRHSGDAGTGGDHRPDTGLRSREQLGGLMQPGPASSLRSRTSRSGKVRSDASWAYRIAVACLVPVVRWWGRLEVIGVDLIPQSGPVLLVANHDSAWDPPIIGVASVRRRQVHALARGSLWGYWGLGWLMDRLGAIPVSREAGNDRRSPRRSSRSTPALRRAVPRRHGVARPHAACAQRGRAPGPRGAVRAGRLRRDHRVDVVSRFPLRPQAADRVLPADGRAPVRRLGGGDVGTLLDEIRALSPPAPAPKPRRHRQAPLARLDASGLLRGLARRRHPADRGRSRARETTAVIVYAASVSGAVRRQRALPPGQLDHPVSRASCSDSTTR